MQDAKHIETTARKARKWSGPNPSRPRHVIETFWSVNGRLFKLQTRQGDKGQAIHTLGACAPFVDGQAPTLQHPSAPEFQRDFSPYRGADPLEQWEERAGPWTLEEAHRCHNNALRRAMPKMKR